MAAQQFAFATKNRVRTRRVNFSLLHNSWSLNVTVWDEISFVLRKRVCAQSKGSYRRAECDIDNAQSTSTTLLQPLHDLSAPRLGFIGTLIAKTKSVLDSTSSNISPFPYVR